MAALIVFIDSLRFEAPLSGELEALGLSRAAFVPPLGFSANILPLLFRGKTPDELGFFNEYGLSRTVRKQWLAVLDPAVEAISRAPLARKVVYGLLARTGVSAANIPFRLLPHFERQSVPAYEPTADDPSLLQELGFHLELASRVRARSPERDRITLAAAMENVHRDRLYVSLNDLDAISHGFGLDSDEYAAHEVLALDGVRELVGAFRRRHGPGAAVVVLGDHGMTPVVSTVNPDIEGALGPVGRDRYVYFLDSTFVRIWSFDPAVSSALEDFFADLGAVGRFVTAGERERWGIESPAFGTHIFALDEGVMFAPNFIGRGVPLAMHGYHPEHTSQHAAFLTSRAELLPAQRLEGAQAYHTLRATVGRA